jgi:hypothetical protein
MTATVTMTPTPGEGVYNSVVPDTFVTGSTGNRLDINLTSGSTAYPAAGGLLTFYFPAGFSAPQNTVDFFVYPGIITNPMYTFNGRTVSVQIKNLPPDTPLKFGYGQSATGFAVTSNQASEIIRVYSYPQSVSLGAGGILAAQPTIAIVSPTVTPTITLSLTSSPTPTITPTFTISETFTITPTPSISETFTVSPTQTPLGRVETGTVYSYPNPYDIQKFDKVTFRFDPDPQARVTVFNLAGEPVREIPASDIQGALGFAIWHGEDDSIHKVAGGLYFVRVKGKNTFIRKFTILN